MDIGQQNRPQSSKALGRHNQATGSVLTDCWIGHNDHDIGVSSEIVDESCKVGMTYFHALETSLRPPNFFFV